VDLTGNALGDILRCAKSPRGSRMRNTFRMLAVTLTLGLATILGSPASQAADSDLPVKIGIIGTGRIGSALARAWIKAGHEVFVSSRHPEQLQALVAELGPQAHEGTPREAAAFGTVILVSVPYSAMPQIGNDLRAELAGKIILDTSNPASAEGRDAAMAQDAQQKGAGVADAEFLHSTRLVRAFNCIGAGSLANDGFRKPQQLAIPIGGDDAQALAVAERLIREIGFDPVRIGSLARTRLFDLGQPLATGRLTAPEMRSKASDL
jgi:predicted dinucleotide-binding enzyme